MHALCAFFLDQGGPGHASGEQTMLPFLVNMERLYERFVAEWLRLHLSDSYRLQVQERYAVDQVGGLHFDIDLVVYNETTGQARWVMDTKYKTRLAAPAAEDVAQVLAYAQAKSAPEAVLIYPTPLPQPLDANVNGIRVRSVCYTLDGDLENAGQRLLASLANGQRR
jgi:5-methylcytosine-specific restriction enzyme subunit McrC